jgi:choline dehydrogenase-like flavoprotein
VADASILPDAPSVATNLTVIMAAELLADRFDRHGPGTGVEPAS